MSMSTSCLQGCCKTPVLTVDTTRYLLGLVREELSFGSRLPSARQAQLELEQYLAGLQAAEARPLLFAYEPHLFLPLSVWRLGDLDEPQELEAELGSALEFGLHILHLAVTASGQRVDLTPLDPGVIEFGGYSDDGRYKVAASRARTRIAAKHPLLAAVLKAVTVRNDRSATFIAKVGSPEIIVKS